MPSHILDSFFYLEIVLKEIMVWSGKYFNQVTRSASVNPATNTILAEVGQVLERGFWLPIILAKFDYLLFTIL